MYHTQSQGQRANQEPPQPSAYLADRLAKIRQAAGLSTPTPPASADRPNREDRLTPQRSDRQP